MNTHRCYYGYEHSENVIEHQDFFFHYEYCEKFM